ncbi:polysaccharide biosynthesis protein [Methylobacterium sp. 4-46]|uniref:lipopolysaccharide biosynthesis protein n=1 Tax=unclassified Methylobacterium TaxID=2615210 RepID=UPI000152D900|nr:MULTISPECIES: oligosaccharide flippase family protein [Methylobacterium]ACA18391.1 polysaccharide biosynthesis protein [Methylobacterium sp. 4-46]WFT77681.1 oligosaccharide flippase family protein [Methylobacterium nodulans]
MRALGLPSAGAGARRDRAASLRRLANSVAGSGVLLFGLKIAGCALGLAMHLAFARLLGAAAYGTFATAFNAAALVALFAAGGLPLTASRFLPVYLSNGARAEARAYLDTVAAATVGGGLLGSGILAAAAAMLGADDPGLACALAAASPLVLLLATAQTATALLQALHRPFAAEAAFLLVRPIAATGMGAVLALPAFGLLDAVTALIAVSLASLAALLATADALRRAIARHALTARGRPSLGVWVRPGLLLLFLVGGAALAERLDVMVVSAFADPEAAGIYSVAARFAALISLGTAAATVRALPMLAEQLGRGDRDAAARTLAQASRAALALAAAAGLGLAIAAGPLLGLFGAGFRSGTTALCLLAAAHMALAAGGAASTALIASGNERRIATVTGLGILANVTANLLLVPRFGMTGAAAATLATMALTAFGLTLTARRVLGLAVFAGRDLRAEDQA